MLNATWTNRKTCCWTSSVHRASCLDNEMIAMWHFLDFFFFKHYFPAFLELKLVRVFFYCCFSEEGRASLCQEQQNTWGGIILTVISAACCSLPERFHHFPKDETLNARPENSVIKRTETLWDISCPRVSSKVSDGAWKTRVCILCLFAQNDYY